MPPLSSPLQPTYQLVETALGNTFLVRQIASGHLSALNIGDSVTVRHTLDITEDEFNALMDQSMTSTFKYDESTGIVIVTPKESS